MSTVVTRLPFTDAEWTWVKLYAGWHGLTPGHMLAVAFAEYEASLVSSPPQAPRE